jgi:hypothetical protein
MKTTGKAKMKHKDIPTTEGTPVLRTTEKTTDKSTDKSTEKANPMASMKATLIGDTSQ